MTEYRFETHRPVHLAVEIGRGSVEVTANDTTETHVQIQGRDAELVEVRQDGDRIAIRGPRQRSLFSAGDRLDVEVTVPTGSDVAVRTGSADVRIHGTVASGQVKSGSGEVTVDTATGPLQVETGSGDIQVRDAEGALQIKSGSGDIDVREVGGTLMVSTGSGDVQIARTRAASVVKTGSGDLQVGEAQSDLSFATGSGDLVVRAAYRGRLTAKGASGDMHVGVRAGVPVWTDVSTVTGEIRSSLTGAGEPEPGEEHLELRAKTVSGDVVLTQV
ncbi:DUF4097 family beta strand repeat protein [Nocardioides sp. MAH-18]|uniref:DUF4097 family beta strand repeat protein n=1 Tax=Nocardioides agri TaxID=2682843 RepID=A0A6L6XQJ6_9ACTN|nr:MULTISPECIES: DUF4097 family beta strand repeat-containing protein [unclassified Nocardioides]MBA2954776.1 DUF4097 family beta strand repeat protein [Nocardioides sp. CGMCC 1.13656]MVQ49631.1 DUF4097 family beta strand repeat protein [Nocardioides sp. MAH-18]